MRNLFVFLLLASVAFAQSVDPQSSPQLPSKDAIRIREFYRLAPSVSAQVWPNWANTPAPLLLVTDETEFLTHDAQPPGEFKKVADDLYARPRHFPTNLLATFPAFGPPSIIVIGEAEKTEAKNSTPWLFVLLHEHFHQLQDSQPGMFEEVNKLGLAHGDETGMWMLNYPFPYEKPELGHSFVQLRDLSVKALKEQDDGKFRLLAKQYTVERKKFFAALSADDRKYLSFQLWKKESHGTFKSSRRRRPRGTSHPRSTRRSQTMNLSRAMQRGRARTP